MQRGKVLITGGTSGLGYELVKFFLREGYDVFATGRNQSRLIDSGERLHFVKVDFSDLADVKKSIQCLLDNGTRFDIVINNAGVLSPSEFTLTGNYVEYSFQVNFLSHLLLDELIVRGKSDIDPLTVVSVTSPVYKYVAPDYKIPEISRYRPFKVYAESKLYLLLIGEHLHKKYPEKDMRFIGYDPGTFSSGIYRMQKSWFQKMYRVAAPFMRSPLKVAKNLGEILEQNEIITGAIYRRKDSYRILNNIDKELIENFMTNCYDMIESFIR